MRILSLTQTMTTRDGGPETTITSVIEDDGDRQVYIVSDGNPNYSEVTKEISRFKDGETSNAELAKFIKDSVNTIQAVTKKLVQVKDFLDGRMNISGNRVTIDHEPIDNVLEAHILRLLKADGTPKDLDNWKAFGKFIENLYGNMSEYVRNQLFGWLNYENMKGHGFTITPDGCFIGYKGCAGNSELPVSIHTGSAIVDGEYKTGAIPNKIGSVIEMPRNQVEDDPSVGCSQGLHVGTYDYAKNWARGVLLTVKVNPRDVVSVPVECSAQKIRTCRYEVLDTTEVAYTEPTWDYDDDDDYSYCEDCDEEHGYCDCEDGDEEYDYESDVEDETNDYESDVELPNEGSVISFTYTKGNGVTKHYQITVTDETSTHLYGTLHDGSRRTFVKARITSLEVEDDVNDYRKDAADFEPGDILHFTYLRKDGVTKSYSIVVRHVNSYYVDGSLLNKDQDEYRSFIKSRMNDVEVEYNSSNENDSSLLTDVVNAVAD